MCKFRNDTACGDKRNQNGYYPSTLMGNEFVSGRCIPDKSTKFVLHKHINVMHVKYGEWRSRSGCFDWFAIKTISHGSTRVRCVSSHFPSDWENAVERNRIFLGCTVFAKSIFKVDFPFRKFFCVCGSYLKNYSKRNRLSYHRNPRFYWGGD